MWAANHWKSAVDLRAANHPGAVHACQDLHQTNWRDVPAHDLMVASPCCQGFSRARGKLHGNPQHDASRSTAWAVVSAAEHHRPPFAVIENVPEFTRLALYPAWCAAMTALSYCLTPMIVDAADHGVPQHRVRLFIAAVRAKQPLMIRLSAREHLRASSFIDFDGGAWQPVDKPDRAPATLARIHVGRRVHGKRFIVSYYGNERGGRSIDRPVGTIITRDRHAIVDGPRMRMFSAQECRAVMGFSKNCRLPAQHRLAVHMLGKRFEARRRDLSWHFELVIRVTPNLFYPGRCNLQTDKCSSWRA